LPLAISLDNIVNKAEVEAFEQKQAENDNKEYKLLNLMLLNLFTETKRILVETRNKS